MPTTLLQGAPGSNEQKCDTIYTATVLGFSAVHAELGHQFAFEGEAWNTAPADRNQRNLEDYQSFLHLLSGLTAVLEGAGVPIGSALRDDLSPTQDDHNKFICGWPGGHAMAPHNRVFGPGDRRDDQPSSPSRFRANLASIGPRVRAELNPVVGYVGPGAYTGAVMVNAGSEAIFSSTTQCVKVPNVADRWTGPPSPMGMIAGAHDKARPEGFGRPPIGQLVGYTHGMSYAMRDALAIGPAAVPVEVTSGANTTKQASCFACTTYMWANGFPPSATHLGSALSWHPIVAEKEEDPKKRAIVESMNVRFHVAVDGYIQRGAEILIAARESLEYDISPLHRAIAGTLLAAQQARSPRAHEIGGNFFLDACTFHKNDKIRLNAVIQSRFR